MIDFDSEYWFRALRDGLGAQVVPISSEGEDCWPVFERGRSGWPTPIS
ncbi:hypothetical protein [Lysobacter gummosus]